MQFEFWANTAPRAGPPRPVPEAAGRQIAIRFVRHPRARRYLLRLTRDGNARVTIPRGGSEREARRFVDRHSAWLERQWLRYQQRTLPRPAWVIGTRILLRGESVPIESAAGRDSPALLVGGQTVPVSSLEGDLRHELEPGLWRLAAQEMPVRVLELATAHQFVVNRVTVRDQRSRWGSCSRRGAIALNWRLIQAPPSVLDYLILHELAHLREMNHSPRFWREVARLCPTYLESERWLKTHGHLLRQAD